MPHSTFDNKSTLLVVNFLSLTYNAYINANASMNVSNVIEGLLKSKGINTSRPKRNEQHFADDIFKRIFYNINVWISIKISPKFVPKGPINNIPTLVQIMDWRRSGDKPLSEPVMVSSLTHICVTRPQWVNRAVYIYICIYMYIYISCRYAVSVASNMV